HGASKESRFLVFARSEPRFAILVEGASELANVPVEKLAPPHSLPENIADLASHELDEHRFVLDLELVRHAVLK
ncbi:MAG: hypothetical protein R3270_11615, partial [Gammaproteobacteria bacterium]|nr:hypothetical protein [Gammaproteobacteria bacterium]